MSQFLREMPPFRLVETHHGDTLQTVAHREMSDANRWPELVWINRLSFPYLTDDERRVGPGVLLTGSFLKVPAPAGLRTEDAERGQVYERDAELKNRRLMIDDGDLAIVAGANNLRQQLQHRIGTPRGQARRHPRYGCMIWRILGTAAGPTAGMLGTQYVRSSLLSDYRISEVISSESEVAGDVVRITVRARAIDGGVIDLIGESHLRGDSMRAVPGFGNAWSMNWGM